MAPLFDHREIRRLERDAGDWKYSNPTGHLDRITQTVSTDSYLRQLMMYRARFQLSEDMLVKVDRMSMANSLEVRAPMLDVAVATAAARMPDSLLIKQGTTKYILREASRAWLPDEVFSHPKWGFSIPLHDYQNAAYRRLCDELLLTSNDSICQKLFDSTALRQIVERGLTRKQDAADVSVFRATHQVWALLQLAAWAHEFDVSL